MRLYFCPYSFLTGRHETGIHKDQFGQCYPVTTATLTVAVKDAESFQHHFEGMSRTLRLRSAGEEVSDLNLSPGHCYFGNVACNSAPGPA